MSDPTAYHRKLAEAIRDKLAVRHPERESIIGCLAAVLASEGVVDPVEMYRDLLDKGVEVERLEALLAKGHASSDKRDDEICAEAKVEERDRIIQIVDRYWKFDERQIHMHSWHDKQDCLNALRSTGDSDE